MPVKILPVNDDFAAEVEDVDLAAPLDATALTTIRQAFRDYAVLVFPGQDLDEGQQLEFARHFGPIEDNLMSYNADTKFRVNPELIDISNLTYRGEIWDPDSRVRGLYLGNQLWHTDSSFKFVPARASLLYARAIPPVGGNTEFADMRAAWDALPEELRSAIDGRIAEHAFETSRARTGFAAFTEAEREKLPPVPQALVRTMAESGRRALYLASHAGRIVGMPDDEGRALLETLVEFATQPAFVYAHRWRVGDLVMWDNRCTMHRGRPFDDLRYKRDMLRATVSDEINSCEREGLTAEVASAG